MKFEHPSARAGHSPCVSASTPTGSSYVKRWFCASTRAWSTSVRASATRPLIAAPMWESISEIFSTLRGSRRGDDSRFSTARTEPCFVWRPMAVEPSLMACRRREGKGGRGAGKSATRRVRKHGTRAASAVATRGRAGRRTSMAYSTWKRRPSGEKVFTPLSYSERVRYMAVWSVVHEMKRGRCA